MAVMCGWCKRVLDDRNYSAKDYYSYNDYYRIGITYNDYYRLREGHPEYSEENNNVYVCKYCGKVLEEWLTDVEE